MAAFRAIRIDKVGKGQSVALVDFDEKDLMDGDVTVRVEWSTINYKDGLALTGKSPVVRRFPMIPGIDLAGTVEASSNPAWKPGDQVILDGFGLGETHLGDYADKAGYRVIASTGRPQEATYLRDLGAAEVIERNELTGQPRPLAKERWAAGIDTVGSTTLANVLSMTAYGGAVAACGLAGGMDLPSSRAPFILP